MTYLEQKQFGDAIHEFETALTLSGVRSTVIARIGIAHAEAGSSDKALKVLDELSTLSKFRFVSPYDVAAVWLALGEADRAFEHLEASYRQRDGFMIYLKVDPAMKRAWADPRYEDMLCRMAFPIGPRRSEKVERNTAITGNQETIFSQS